MALRLRKTSLVVQNIARDLYASFGSSARFGKVLLGEIRPKLRSIADDKKIAIAILHRQGTRYDTASKDFVHRIKLHHCRINTWGTLAIDRFCKVEATVHSAMAHARNLSLLEIESKLKRRCDSDPNAGTSADLVQGVARRDKH